MSTGALITDVNWIPSIKPQEAIKCNTKFRYRQKDNPVTLTFIDENTVKLEFDQPSFQVLLEYNFVRIV